MKIENVTWTSDDLTWSSEDIKEIEAGSYATSSYYTAADSITTTDPNFAAQSVTGYVTTNVPLFSGANWEPTTLLPEELKVCQVCGVEDVVVLCGECKNIMNWARQKWAEAMMKELEDDLS